jgi:hypothetical protein
VTRLKDCSRVRARITLRALTIAGSKLSGSGRNVQAAPDVDGAGDDPDEDPEDDPEESDDEDAVDEGLDGLESPLEAPSDEPPEVAWGLLLDEL